MKKIHGIPEELLEDYRTTAVCKLKKDFVSYLHRGNFYLPKGTLVWTYYVWSDESWPINNNVHAYFLSDKTVECAYISLDYLKIVKKLPLWDTETKSNWRSYPCSNKFPTSKVEVVKC